ncbi:MAG: peptidylprolyl isomerase [Saprospiraceae bacterium]|nr:peptidylprolyl isomerase [Saprospiraceae bacterium]
MDIVTSLQWRFFNRRSVLLYTVLSILLIACHSDPANEAQEITLTEVNVDLSDSLARKIINLQDRLQADSLLKYFNHRDPTFRYLAARAFASLKNPVGLDSLIAHLDDPVREVRKMVAYSLGQVGDVRAESALISAFQAEDSIDANNELNATILEAIGKCGTQKNLSLLSQVTTYRDTDHHLLRGQSRAIFRFMQRGIVNESGTQRMVNLLSNPEIPDDIRTVACHYLARADVDLQDHSDLITLTFSNLDSSDLKNTMPLVLAKCHTREANLQLQDCIARNKDFRLNCNALRAMGRTNFRAFRTTIQQGLYDRRIAVASTAAEVILQYGDANYWRTYMNLSLSNFPWQVKITLLHAVSKHIPAGNAMFSNMNFDFLRQRINNTTNLYEKAAGIQALAEDPGRFGYIISLKKNSTDPVISTACIQALKNIAVSTRFRRLSANSQKEIIDELVMALNSGDVGMVEQASAILDMDLSPYGYEINNLIDRAEENLQIPRDMEALIPLHRKKAELEGKVYDPKDDFRFTHAIDWKTLDAAGDAPRARITTNKGSFTVALFRTETPGTVANFLDLVNLNYYANKPIHRVVPGFVIQGGCNRGDGYGSLDYNIRSELPQLYYDAPGYLGMASAGNNTESAQWFVTQSATPHLDGNYTLFGEVMEGMEVVNNTEVGDTILEITVL